MPDTHGSHSHEPYTAPRDQRRNTPTRARKRRDVIQRRDMGERARVSSLARADSAGSPARAIGGPLPIRRGISGCADAARARGHTATDRCYSAGSRLPSVRLVPKSWRSVPKRWAHHHLSTSTAARAARASGRTGGTVRREARRGLVSTAPPGAFPLTRAPPNAPWRRLLGFRSSQTRLLAAPFRVVPDPGVTPSAVGASAR